MSPPVDPIARVKSLGAEWRASLASLSFLGELDVNEAVVDEMCRHFRNQWCLGALSYDEDVRTAYAVTVINLAYFAPDREVRRHVCERLGYSFSSTTWEQDVGAPVLEVLTRYLREELRPGPYRFVTPILRQAGIAASASRQFAEILVKLVSRCGDTFTLFEYQQAIESIASNNPAPLFHFLRTKAGYEFCRDLARNIRNIRDGIITWESLRSSQGFRGHLVERIREAISTTAQPARTGSLPKPQLILDREECCLAVRFGNASTASRYHWANGSPVRRSVYPLQEGDLGRTLQGSIRHPKGTSTTWALTCWSPDVSQWVAFRPDDGLFLKSEGRLGPGRYLLAIAGEHVPTQNVHEDLGELILPDHDAWYRVVDCTLEEGFEVESIGLVVGGDSSGAPWLRFVSEARPVSGTSNVFAGTLPRVEIVDWDKQFADRFAIVTAIGDSRNSIPRRELDKGPLISVAPSGVGSGVVSIEPIGRAPHGFVDAPLAFVVVESGTSIHVPRGLKGADERVLLRVTSPVGIDVRWNQAGIVSDDPNSYSVPPEVELVDGTARTSTGIEFDLSIRLPRLDISGTAFDRQILWSDVTSRDGSIEIRLSDDEVGTNPVLVLDTATSPLPLATLPTIPKSGRRVLTTADIKDELRRFDTVAARFAVQLAGSAGSIVRSSTFFVDASAVERWLAGTEEFSGFDPNVSLPPSIATVLRQLSDLRHQPGRMLKPNVLVLPDRLARVATCIVASALALDDGISPEGELDVEPGLVATLHWYLEAREILEIGESAAERSAALLNSFPKDHSPIPFERWRQQLAESRRQLISLSDVEAVVREWSSLCRERKWELAKASNLGSRPGGATLSDGAEQYYWAMELMREGRVAEARHKLGSALAHFNAAQPEADGDAVHTVARILAALCYVHWQHPKAGDVVAELRSSTSVRWQGVCCDLIASLNETAVSQPANPGLSLRDLSPHNLDQELTQRAR